jgi:hypothetical protein
MPALRPSLRLVPVLLAAAIACSEPTGSPVGLSSAKAANPVVNSADPDAATRDTTLDVRILGSGFGSGSRADFLLSGAPDPKVRTNSTQFVSSTELVANITIDASAAANYRDVQVTTAGGKKGIGTERFMVLLAGEMSVPGVTDPEAWSVNSSGVAAGHGNVPGGAAGFTWSEAAGAALTPVPAGWTTVSPRVINDAGVIAGIVGTAAGVSSFQVVRWTPSGPGTWTIDVLPKPAANLLLLTVHGVTQLGSAVTAWKNPNGTWDSWVWRNASGWRQLAKPSGATWCSTEAVNNAEQITGYCNGSGGGAVYWASPTSAALRLPPLPGGLSNKASAINNVGVIVGSSVFGSVEEAQRWRPNGSGGWIVEDLGAVGNATGINDDGAIVGLNKAVAYYIASGGTPETLGPVSPPNTSPFVAIGNRAADGITWVVGWGRTDSQGYRALWWKK